MATAGTSEHCAFDWSAAEDLSDSSDDSMDDDDDIEDVLDDQWEPDDQAWFLLIKWRTRPLPRCSWKAECELPEIVISDWQNKKQRIKNGEVPAFPRAAFDRYTERKQLRKEASVYQQSADIDSQERSAQAGLQQVIDEDSESRTVLKSVWSVPSSPEQPIKPNPHHLSDKDSNIMSVITGDRNLSPSERQRLENENMSACISMGPQEEKLALSRNRENVANGNRGKHVTEDFAEQTENTILNAANDHPHQQIQEGLLDEQTANTIPTAADDGETAVSRKWQDYGARRPSAPKKLQDVSTKANKRQWPRSDTVCRVSQHATPIQPAQESSTIVELPSLVLSHRRNTIPDPTTPMKAPSKPFTTLDVQSRDQFAVSSPKTSSKVSSMSPEIDHIDVSRITNSQSGVKVYIWEDSRTALQASTLAEKFLSAGVNVQVDNVDIHDRIEVADGSIVVITSGQFLARIKPLHAITEANKTRIYAIGTGARDIPSSLTALFPPVRAILITSDVFQHQPEKATAVLTKLSARFRKKRREGRAPGILLSRYGTEEWLRSLVKNVRDHKQCAKRWIDLLNAYHDITIAGSYDPVFDDCSPAEEKSITLRNEEVSDERRAPLHQSSSTTTDTTPLVTPFDCSSPQSNLQRSRSEARKKQKQPLRNWITAGDPIQGLRVVEHQDVYDKAWLTDPKLSTQALVTDFAIWIQHKAHEYGKFAVIHEGPKTPDVRDPRLWMKRFPLMDVRLPQEFLDR